ncbi:MucR family transcriptional regulator [Bosea eneae]|uniref:MucR family transcriptional regulator n=1 Tax=Bosea eneae TaxID=151454 RepID=A0ABW0J1M7_9HYPH
MVDHFARIVVAFVSHNSVTPASLPSLIQDAHSALRNLRTGAQTPASEDAHVPAVAIKKSIHPDFLICLEDGKPRKLLKRYLRTVHNLTPDAYRAKWGLPADYPMVAPAYAEMRSQMAKENGLGNFRDPAAKRRRRRI